MRQNKKAAGIGRGLLARGQAALGTGSMAANSAKQGAAPGNPGRKDKQLHPLAALAGLETGKLLDPKELNRAARALTALEIRPQVHGYKELANQLTKERNEETSGLGKLGAELQGNVGGVYQGIAGADAQGVAAQQAIASMLNANSASIAQQGSDSLAKMQQGAVGDLNAGLALRNAPTGGGAQQALSDAVAQQQSAQTANAGAAQQFAASQGAGNTALAQQMAASTQMQGGQAVGGIGRDVIGRVGETNQKYGQNIQTALGKLADVKASKGPTMTKNLLELRGNEQKFLLGKQAVAGEKAALAQDQAAAEADAQQQAFDNKLSLAKLGLDRWKAHHPDASSSDVQDKKQEIKSDVREIKSLIAPVVTELGKVPKGTPPNKVLNTYIGKINSKASADPQLVAKVVRAWWENRARKQANVDGLNPWN